MHIYILCIISIHKYYFIISICKNKQIKQIDKKKITHLYIINVKNHTPPPTSHITKKQQRTQQPYRAKPDAQPIRPRRHP